jgi:hypothetical protein
LTPRFSFGVTGGVPLGRMTAWNSALSHDESRRYTFGPSVDLSLTDKLSITVNPLYKRLGNTWSGGISLIDPGPDIAFQYSNRFVSSRAHSLELPVIGKYHFGDGERRWRPFVGAGFAFQTAWMKESSELVTRDKATGELSFQSFTSERRTSTDTGVVASAGLSFRQGPLVFLPEIRYTRWGSASSARDRHQADALLTIRFGR